ncbi:MAG TPA: efflux RND transporter periplasmic adaptor subunit [Luteimonas sp.]|nr:efflux RND transporter periplasmic adaptor subunit [Luteimonas sp.]
MNRRHQIASVVLLAAVAALGLGLGIWKYASLRAAEAAAANQPEPAETVLAAVARSSRHQQSATAIGTVIALRSVTLRNEVAGTVDRVALKPGAVVEAGAVLVALDVSVEQAELKALQAQAQLAQTVLDRVQRMNRQQAISDMELDRARAERDVALAQTARTRAVIARKTIRAPFRARVGIADVHPGQFLDEGTVLTTLQGVDEDAYVDFAVAQHVAAQLATGAKVDVTADGTDAVAADIVAVDARIDPATRNAMVRARVADSSDAFAPGASVRVKVAVGPSRPAVAVPVSALRKGPAGDHVFVLAADREGKMRAQLRAVRVGATRAQEVVIERGLAPGERVAASGAFKLQDAMLVAVADPPSRRTAGVR